MEVQYPDLKFFVGLAVILCIDPIWLYVSSKFSIYPIADEDRQSIIISFGLIPWVVLALAIAMSRPKTIGEAALFGFLLGLMSYLFYNGTEASFSKRWRSLKTMGCDVAWGSVLCTLASVLTYLCTLSESSTTVSTSIAGIVIFGVVMSIVAMDVQKEKRSIGSNTS